MGKLAKIAAGIQEYKFLPNAIDKSPNKKVIPKKKYIVYAIFPFNFLILTIKPPSIPPIPINIFTIPKIYSELERDIIIAGKIFS